MALLPPHYSQAVVALEVGEESSYQTVATGVLMGFRLDPDDQSEHAAHAIYLVTNTHVVEGDSELWARFNSGGSTTSRFKVPVRDPAGSPLWTAHPHFDLTVTPVNLDALHEAGVEYGVFVEEQVRDLAGIEEEGIAVGDGIFVLGFPMGIGGRLRKYVVVRSGIIARLDREIVDDNKGYLIDCVTFPGNSGGPVVLRPAATAIVGTSLVKNAFLIGIVSAYVPYVDTAVSTQTGNTRVTFEENSGLTSVVPIDAVYDLVRPKIEQALAARRTAEAASAEPSTSPDAPEVADTGTSATPEST